MLSYKLNFRVSRLTTEENTCIIYPEISLIERNNERDNLSFRYHKYLSFLDKISGRLDTKTILIDIFIAEKKYQYKLGKIRLGETTGIPIRLSDYPTDENTLVTLHCYDDDEKIIESQSFEVENIADMPTDYALILHYFYTKLAKITTDTSHQQADLNSFIKEVNTILAEMKTMQYSYPQGYYRFIHDYQNFVDQFMTNQSLSKISSQAIPTYAFSIDLNSLQLNAHVRKANQNQAVTQVKTIQFVTPQINIANMPGEMPLLIIDESLNHSDNKIETFAFAISNIDILPQQLEAWFQSSYHAKASFSQIKQKLLPEVYRLSNNLTLANPEKDIVLGELINANASAGRHQKKSKHYIVPVYDSKNIVEKNRITQQPDALTDMENIYSTRLRCLILAMALRRHVKINEMGSKCAIHLYRGIANSKNEFSWVVYSTSQNKNNLTHPVYVIFDNGNRFITFNIRDNNELQQLKEYFLTPFSNFYLPGILGEMCDDFGILPTKLTLDNVYHQWGIPSANLTENTIERLDTLLPNLTEDAITFLKQQGYFCPISLDVMSNPAYIMTKLKQVECYNYDEIYQYLILKLRQYKTAKSPKTRENIDLFITNQTLTDAWNAYTPEDERQQIFLTIVKNAIFRADDKYNEILRIVELDNYYKTNNYQFPAKVLISTQWAPLLKHEIMREKKFKIKASNRTLCPPKPPSIMVAELPSFWLKQRYKARGNLLQVAPLATDYPAQTDMIKAKANHSLLTAIDRTRDEYMRIWTLCGTRFASETRASRVQCRSSYQAIIKLADKIKDLKFDQAFTLVMEYLSNGAGRWHAGKLKKNGYEYETGYGPSIKQLLTEELLTELLGKEKKEQGIKLTTYTEYKQPIRYILDPKLSYVGGCHINGLIEYLKNEAKRQFGLGKKAITTIHSFL